MWYRLVRASKFLGVAPWDLEQQSVTWLLAAEEAQSAEAATRRASQPGTPGGGRTRRGASRAR